MQEGKVFFFEKKNQKTFVCLGSYRLAAKARAKDKSSLVADQPGLLCVGSTVPSLRRGNPGARSKNRWLDGRPPRQHFTLHTSIVHHNGTQYFGYLGDNPVELSHLHQLQQFYTDAAHHPLPAAGGMFFVRGGYFNNDKLLPADPNPAVQASFPGNGDHPAYSGSQLSEASIADSMNAIAASPYWARSAIIITYDESDGYFDHAPFAVRTRGPDGRPCRRCRRRLR